jgi:hypothetical protein
MGRCSRVYNSYAHGKRTSLLSGIGQGANLSQFFYLSQLFYVVIISFAKFSILLFYLHIFPNPRFRLWVKITIAWLGCKFFAFLMAVLFSCVPVNGLWNVTIPAKCINTTGIVYAGAGLSIFDDIWIILLPIPVLKSLNLSLRKRGTLIFMFAMGSL